MASHSSILAWKIPYRGARQAIVHSAAKIRTCLKDLACMHASLHGNSGENLEYSVVILLSIVIFKYIVSTSKVCKSCLKWRF